MEKVMLGSTGIEVTKLCFGALPMGPLQKNMSVDDCADLVEAVLKSGINFIDTAQMYMTYKPIAIALKRVSERPVIATKSAAATYEDMDFAVNQALNELGVDRIDIFHLHAARGDENVFEERKEALRCLHDYKKKGIIKAVGISNHSTIVTALAAERDDIDIVYPIINKKGLGILHGNVKEMEKSIEKCVESGKGVYLMKVLGGGSLASDYKSAMEYAFSIKGIHAISLGMVSKEELLYNIEYFNNNGLTDGKLPDIKKLNKVFKVLDFVCNFCKSCIETCPNNAIVERKGKAFIDKDKCLTCGYCVGACPTFAIRMI
jgi:aryl-alcohol dehydrogenase-like predicted oxidoreductase